jgi:hypothetical protein
MNPVVVFLLCSTSFITPASHGPSRAISEPFRPTVSVRLDVGAPEQLAGAIRQLMTQAFGPYEGVRLVEQNPQWTIKIVTQSLLDDEGQMMAVGLSVVVLEHGQQMDMLMTLAQAWRYVINAGLLQRDQPLEVGMRQLMAAIERLPRTNDLTVLSQHLMCVIPTEKLGDACRDIAIDFNSRVLQPKAERRDSAPAAPARRAS